MSLSLATNNCIRLANNKQRQTISHQQVISRQITGKQKANNKANNKQTTVIIQVNNRHKTDKQGNNRQTTITQQTNKTTITQ